MTDIHEHTTGMFYIEQLKQYVMKAESALRAQEREIAELKAELEFLKGSVANNVA